jgi:thioredoxin 1
MSVICICGFCIPYSVLWPLLLLAIKPLWDRLSKVFGFEPLKVDSKGKGNGKGEECCKEFCTLDGKCYSSKEEMENDSKGENCVAAQNKNEYSVAAPNEKEHSLQAGVVHIGSDEQFESTTGGSHVTIVKFTATWCKPCQRIEPHFQKLAAEASSVVQFAKVDVDELDRVAAECGAISIPMFAAFKNGKRLKTVQTSKEEDLTAFVNDMTKAN